MGWRTREWNRGGSYMESGEDVCFFFGSCDLAVSEFAVFFFFFLGGGCLIYNLLSAFRHVEFRVGMIMWKKNEKDLPVWL